MREKKRLIIKTKLSPQAFPLMRGNNKQQQNLFTREVFVRVQSTKNCFFLKINKMEKRKCGGQNQLSEYQLIKNSNLDKNDCLS
jgi:hypothetical protein